MTKKLRKNFTRISFAVFLSLFPVLSFGQAIIPVGEKIVNPIPGVDSLDGLLQKILEGFIKIGTPIVALAIIYSGFLFVSARGNSEKLSEAKKALTYSIVGAGILLGSWAIAQIISGTVTGLTG